MVAVFFIRQIRVYQSVPSAQYALCACRRSRGDYQGEWASLMLPLDLLSLFRFFRNTKEMKNPALAET